MDETYEILLGLRERYEAHHKLRYTDEALSAAAKFSSQYISDRFLPDKVRPCMRVGVLGIVVVRVLRLTRGIISQSSPVSRSPTASRPTRCGWA